jgi:4-carboxymuconolactone decarboxylase
MPRIPLPDFDALSPAQQDVVDAIRGTGARNGRIPAPYQLSMANPEFTGIWQQMGALLRYRNTLPLRLSELAILVTARHWHCRYEWYAHAPIALQEGLSETILEDIKWARAPNFSRADEHDVFWYTAQLHEQKKVNSDVHSAIAERFGRVGLVDLTGLIGYYTMVAMALNAHEYFPPEGGDHDLPDLPMNEFAWTHGRL